ncbi:hypothetical protein GQE99_12390 [Maritimibacter sp. DP07]|uniref:Uncharacterized protein n=1 Tax=Maritimibacter harenae TaxID=2606218 RepID=A0A845M8C7_9RHOB|nr:hypothetical protein [Maritimibacter harenae]MZR13813.1 hypothetical protein [Maritimibacter harenae]
MKKGKAHLTVDDKEAFLDVVEQFDQESRNLLALMIFALSRHDPKLCEALDELRKTTSGARGPFEAVEVGVLQRLRRVCPKDELKWWERALSFAQRQGNGVMYQGLVDLIERRVAS